MKIIKFAKSLKNKAYCWWIYEGSYFFRKIIHPKSIFYVFSCDYANLGDQALSYVATKIFEELNIKFIEVPRNHVYAIDGRNKLGHFNKRTIVCAGGGYLGTLWFEAEEILRKIIENNKESKIIVFPNSIYYENSDFGDREFEKSISIYNEHKELKIYAREQLSYNKMKKVYSDVAIIPDLVLSLNLSENIFNREGCIICLRKDHEKTRTEEEEKIIVQQAQRLFNTNIRFFDMVKEHDISIAAREKELNEVFDFFAQARLVITDRLHAMVFAAITGTPCIVVNSKSPKIKGCYQWIKHLKYIKFCEDVTEIENLYYSIPEETHKYNNAPFIHYYDELKNDLKEKAKRGKNNAKI